MLKTIARTTAVEPGQVRAFEIREQGAVAAGRSMIPLLRTAPTSPSGQPRRQTPAGATDGRGLLLPYKEPQMAEQEVDRLIRKMNTALTALSEARTKPVTDKTSDSLSNAVNDAYRTYEAADNAIRDYVFRLVGHRH